MRSLASWVRVPADCLCRGSVPLRAGCWIRRKQKRRHDAEKAELLKRMEEETLRAKYAANGAALTVLQSHL